MENHLFIGWVMVSMIMLCFIGLLNFFVALLATGLLLGLYFTWGLG